MSARGSASPIVYLASVVDEKFLRSAADSLELLRAASENRGHHLLASLIAIAKGEAEDDLRTKALDGSRDQDHDDGAALMARKLACHAKSTSLD